MLFAGSHRVVTRLAFAIVVTGLSVAAAGAQDSSRVRDDSASVIARSQSAGTRMQRVEPPLSPPKAFLTSLAIPGLAQARFDRGSAGALFVAVELGALAMIKRSSDQVREARRFLNDSLPTTFTVGTDGVLTPVGLSTGGFTRDLIRRRKLHLEDWLAVVAFNHLLSGADAFVSAQLWDLPTAVSVYPSHGGAVLVASIKW